MLLATVFIYGANNASLCRADDFLIDSFIYGSPEEAKAAWVPSLAAQDPQPATVDGIVGLNLPSAFTSLTTRSIWNKTVDLDLSGYDRFYFRMKVHTPANVQMVSIYFRTGSGGWWVCYNAVPLNTDQWQTIVLPKSSFSKEGTCTGWMKITQIRVSVWQAQPQPTTVSIANFWAKQDSLLIDSFQYVTTTGWYPVYAGGTAVPATVDNVYGLRLPCNFTSQTTRAVWYKNITRDFSKHDRFYFRIKIADPENVNQITIYFRDGTSGNYWARYFAAPFLSNQWQTIVIDKSSFVPDSGAVSNWSNINQVMVSVWQSLPNSTDVYMSDLMALHDDYVIDSCQYATSVDAQKVWKSSYGSSPSPVSATIDGIQCLKLPCVFTSNTARMAWERDLTLDFTKYDKFTFKVKFVNVSNINYITLHFKTGSGGWYFKNNDVQLLNNQWQTIEMSKQAFGQEGTCPGWGDLVTLRFSAWKAQVGNSEVYLSDIRAEKTPENIITNGSFEVCSTASLPDYWGMGSWGLTSEGWITNTNEWRSRWGVNTSQAYSGTKSLRIAVSSSWPSLLASTSFVKVLGGNAYTLSAWIKSDTAGLPVTLSATNATPQQFSVDGTWRRYAITFTPSSNSSIKCTIQPSGNGTVWIDDVKLERNNTATAYRPAANDATLNGWAIHRTIPQVADYPVTPGPDTVQVSIDSNRRFLVDGQPFIPFAAGWESIPTAQVINHLALAGFNTVCFLVPANAAVAQIQAALDTIKSKGMKAIVWMANSATLSTVENWVLSLKNHPAIIAWYIYDEPSSITPAIQDRYNLVKQKDPTRPVYINYVYYTKNQLGDIASLDYYPVPDFSLMQVGLRAQVMDTVAATAGKPSWIWLQLHGNAYFFYREPTGPEAECMTYLSLIKGSRGFKYFAHKPHSQELWDQMRLLTREIRTLTPIVYSLETAPSVSVTPAAVHWVAKTYLGQKYIIAVNVSPSSVTATINVPSGNTTAEVLFENRQKSISNNQIIDSFEPFQRHVYRVY